MLQELHLQLGHVYVGRAFTLAALAGEAEIEDVVDLVVVELVFLVAIGEELAEDVSPGAGGVFFVAGGHVAGAHGTAAEVRLAAVARAIALLRMLQDGLFREMEDGLDIGRFLPGFVAQHAIHGRRVHDLVGIEDVLRVPVYFNWRSSS